MRALAILVTLLVLATPFAASQSDDGEGDGSGSASSSSSSSSSGSPSPQPDRPDRSDGNATDDPDEVDDDDVVCPMPERRPDGPAEQRACFCRANPEARACGGDGTEDELADEQAGEWRRWCRDEASTDAARERCRRLLDEFRAEQGQPQRVTFEVDAPNRTLYDYRIGGRPVFDAIHLDTGSDNFTVQRLGAALRIGDADTELVLHDDPTGLVRFKGDDGSLAVRLADGSVVQADEAGLVARVILPGGSIGHLRAGNATWFDGHTLLASEFFAFLLPPAAEPASAPGADDGDDGDAEDDDGQAAAEQAEVHREVGRAITDRKVGAEIAVSGPAAPSAADAGDEGTVQILAYDDVDVEVNVPSDVATPDAPIRIKVSAELDEGRTIVLKLDRSVLESADPETLVLRYFDVYDQADGSEVQTEVVFQQASDLEDVLAPGDDGGQPEYWVVEDANGLQVLVSVPHWSAHAITVGSVAAALGNPSVIIGIVVGLSGTVVAAVAMLWPRRPDEE